MEFIAYKGGYKYQLATDHVTNIEIYPEEDIDSNEFILLKSDGQLIIKKGYAWDGPSGPTIDTLNFMRSSLVHDALYQLMRNNYLDRKIHRNFADRLLQKMCKKDGMSSLRAWWVYLGVHKFGKSAADFENKKDITYAPKKFK